MSADDPRYQVAKAITELALDARGGDPERACTLLLTVAAGIAAMRGVSRNVYIAGATELFDGAVAALEAGEGPPR